MNNKFLLKRDSKKLNDGLDNLGFGGVNIDLEKMVNDGHIEIVGMKGVEPIYKITEKGKKYLKDNS